MVVVPPLLAGLIRHSLSSRIAGVTFTEFADTNPGAAGLRDTSADIVVLGPSAGAEDARLIRHILPRAQVLAVSSDLAHLVDFDTGERVAFSSDTLVDWLQR